MNLVYRRLSAELTEIVREVRDIYRLREMFGSSSVLTLPSACETDRTIELQILEDDPEQVNFVAFSDGKTGSLGVSAIASPSGIKLSSLPRIYIDGVPCHVIEPGSMGSESLI